MVNFLGAALDVFPKEPLNNEEEFISKLRGLKNVILSPHIGGSTKEAQKNIGSFVPDKIIDFYKYWKHLKLCQFSRIISTGTKRLS